MNSRFADFFNRVKQSDGDVVFGSPGRVEIKLVKSPNPLRPNHPNTVSSAIFPEEKLDKKHHKFRPLLSESIINLEKVQEISWMGIPDQFRARVWRLFLDYEPISSAQSASTLEHKRSDYFDCLHRLFNTEQQQHWTSSQRETHHQICIDLPRTRIKILRNARVIQLFEHVLFVWAMRHPAAGYVQGMNDILLPFFYAFVMEKTSESADSISNRSSLDDVISDVSFMEIEADCFWCFGKLLDGIQDVFTHNQPGLHRMFASLQDLLRAAVPDLAAWISSSDIDLTNVWIRWMNCLLVREFPITVLFRVWDIFVADRSQITVTMVRICAAMMETLAPTLINLPEAEFIMELQSLAPEFWTVDKMETVLALAFVYEKTIPLVCK